MFLQIIKNAATVAPINWIFPTICFQLLLKNQCMQWSDFMFMLLVWWGVTVDDGFEYFLICSNLCLYCFAKIDIVYDVAVFYLKFHVMLCSVAIAHMYLHNGLFFSGIWAVIDSEQICVGFFFATRQWKLVLHWQLGYSILQRCLYGLSVRQQVSWQNVSEGISGWFLFVIEALVFLLCFCFCVSPRQLVQLT